MDLLSESAVYDSGIISNYKIYTGEMVWCSTVPLRHFPIRLPFNMISRQVEGVNLLGLRGEKHQILRSKRSLILIIVLFHNLLSRKAGNVTDPLFENFEHDKQFQNLRTILENSISTSLNTLPESHPLLLKLG